MEIITITVERLYTFKEEDNYTGPEMVSEMAEFSFSAQAVRVGNQENCEFFLKTLNTVVEFHRDDNEIVVFAAHPGTLIKFGADDDNVVSKGPLKKAKFPVGSHVRFEDMRIFAQLNSIEDDLAKSEHLVIKGTDTPNRPSQVVLEILCILTGIGLLIAAYLTYSGPDWFLSPLFILLAIFSIFGFRISRLWVLDIGRNLQIKMAQWKGLRNKQYDLRDDTAECLICDLPEQDMYGNPTQSCGGHSESEISALDLRILTGTSFVRLLDLFPLGALRQDYTSRISFFTKMPILYLKYRYSRNTYKPKCKDIVPLLALTYDRIKVKDGQ